MAKVVVLGCIVTCIVFVSCRSLISFWCPSATWWAKHASPSLFLFYCTTASAIHPKAQEKWLPSVFGPRPSGVGWCFLMHLWGIGIFLTVTSIIVLTNQAFIESVLLWPDWSSWQTRYLWPWQSSLDKWRTGVNLKLRETNCLNCLNPLSDNLSQVVVYKPLEKRLGLEQTGCLGAISIVFGFLVRELDSWMAESPHWASFCPLLLVSYSTSPWADIAA